MNSIHRAFAGISEEIPPGPLYTEIKCSFEYEAMCYCFLFNVVFVTTYTNTIFTACKVYHGSFFISIDI